MSFRPKPKTATLTMEEIRGIMQAKEQTTRVQSIDDTQLAVELQRRGYSVNKQSNP